MKIVLSLFVLLAGAAQATTHTCPGVRGTKGTVTLTLYKNQTARVEGAYISPDADDQQTEVFIDCRSAAASIEKRSGAFYRYYSTTKGGTCPADYLRVRASILPAGEGILAVVDTTGGDDHDGYGYNYFYCTRDR